MINSFLLSIGQRHRARTLGSALLVVLGVLVYPLPLLKAGGLASGEPGLVAQARAGPDVAVPAEVKAWRQQVQVLVQQGKFSEAISLQQEDLAWSEKTYGPDHPITATSLNNLAFLYKNQGFYAKAGPIYLRALAINEKALGPDHPDTALSLNNLADLYVSQGAYAKAEPLLRRGIGTQSLFLQGQLPFLPQAARLAQVQALDSSWEAAFSGAERSSSAAELALFSRLKRYGLLLEIEQRQAQLARAPGSPQTLARQIANLTTKLADVAIPAAQRQELGKGREELERELYRLLPSLKPQLVEPAQVARLLPAGAVLVEFQRYKPFDGRQKEGQRWGAPRYIALVLNPAGTTRAVDLAPTVSKEVRSV